MGADTKNGESEAEIRQSVGGGILSAGQIDYLVNGRGDLKYNAVKQRRRKVRNNFQTAIPDLALLSEMDDKDLFRAFAPLTDPRENIEESLAEHNVLSSRELANFDISDHAGDDDLSYAMHQGVRELMAVVAYLFGPESFGQIAEDALNQGQARRALAQNNDELDMYEMTLDPVDMVEKIEEDLS